MDMRYDAALRNATHAWARHRMTDSLTMQDLKRRNPQALEHTQVVTATSASDSAMLQPELARYGHLGTRLNVFA